jgi:hypothetical protein
MLDHKQKENRNENAIHSKLKIIKLQEITYFKKNKVLQVYTQINLMKF